MTIIYTTEPIPNSINKSIFLAGPSLRSEQQHLISWREKALDILDALQYDGIVFVPESKTGCFDGLDYDTVTNWESKCLNIADNILFYINRNVNEGLLGLTTNDEFGYWKDSGKCILVTPPDADSVRYQEKWATELGMPLYHDLYNGIKSIIDSQGEGEIRTDGLRYIPLYIYNLPQFQSWYADIKTAGNNIQEAKLLKLFKTKSGHIFAYSLWANIFITKENRYKNNEFVVSRLDISACLMYYFRPDPMDCEIVLVSEFRTPVSNKEGMVYELPGGSTIKPNVDPLVLVMDEVNEETGFKLKQDKINFEGALQLAATVLTHKCHLYSYELDSYELDQLKVNSNKTFGNIEDTELTYLHVYKVKDIIDKGLLDWSNVGMILKVLNKNID
jgi:hypothetical protein